MSLPRFSFGSPIQHVIFPYCPIVDARRARIGSER